MNEEDQKFIQPVKKKFTSKIRSQFLNKKPQSQPQEEEEIKSPWENALPNSGPNMLVDSIALVEVNRKVYAETSLHNIHRGIDSILFEELPSNKRITLNLFLNQNYHLKPWEYSVKRLESYGDLNLAVWAKKVKHYHDTYEECMQKYFNMLATNDEKIAQNLAKLKIETQQACDYIEANFPYHKAVLFAGKLSLDVVSMAFSDDFLKEMGHTMHSFAEWAKLNGLPRLFDNDSSLNIDFAQRFLSALLDEGKLLMDAEEFVTSMYDSKGNKKKFVFKNQSFLEPTAEGIKINLYIYISSKKVVKNDMESKPDGMGGALKLLKNCSEEDKEHKIERISEEKPIC